MYVCICNAVTDSQVRKAVAEGHDTAEALQDELGVSTCCGACRDTVDDLLAGCRGRSNAPVAITFPAPVAATAALSAV